MSFAPEVVTGDFTLGKVTCPLHSGNTFVFVPCLYLHLVVFFAVDSFLPSLLCARSVIAWETSISHLSYSVTIQRRPAYILC